MAILRCGPWYEFEYVGSELTKVGPSDPVDDIEDFEFIYFQPVNATWSASGTWPFQWRSTEVKWDNDISDYEYTLSLSTGFPPSYSDTNGIWTSKTITFAYQAVSAVNLSITYDCSVTTGDDEVDGEMEVEVRYGIDGVSYLVASDISDFDKSEVSVSGTATITLPATVVPSYVSISVTAGFSFDVSSGPDPLASIEFSISD